VAALHVYAVGDCEWYVAESPEHAVRLWTEMTGCTLDDLDGEMPEQLDDAASMSIYPDEDHTNPATRETKTCGEWAASNGTGPLCSTEF
jgi:hypothetical protein